MERRRANVQQRGRFIRPHRQPLGYWVAAFFISCLAGLGLMANTPSAMGQTAEPMRSPVPDQTTVGIYLTALHEIDPSRDLFLADFYVWTMSAANAPDPLAKLIVVRARSQTVLYEFHHEFGNQLWSLRKYRCEVINDWDLGNFPFDAHVIAIAVIPYSDEYTPPVCQLDEKNSGMAKHIAPHGWQISNMKIFNQHVAYGSNFGDPDSPTPYESNEVTASVLLSRKPWRLFLKLMTGAYLTGGAALLGCYMKTNHPPVFAGRMGLQIACLFSAIINHREITNATGQKDVFMLPDALQLLTYVLIFASLLLTLRSRNLNERNQEARAIREERRISLALALLFLVLNVTFVYAAWATSPSTNMLRNIQIVD
jgi:hypothetical protein